MQISFQPGANGLAVVRSVFEIRQKMPQGIQRAPFRPLQWIGSQKCLNDLPAVALAIKISLLDLT